MPDDINELDVTDAGLKAIMGNRFHDETQIESKKDVSNKETTTQKDNRKPARSYEDGKWQPTKEHTWMDSLKECVKWVVGFGGLSFLLFYWKEAGLMADSIAVPCIAVCTALAGWGVGINCTRGNR